MRLIAAICLSYMVFTFLNKGKDAEKIHQLNLHILHLEKRIDSLSLPGNNNPAWMNNRNNENGSVYNKQLSGLCKAITKKGTQCRRKAKKNNYCWQHGAVIAND